MRIYLSYRRRDTAGEAGRLSDRLAARFGPQSVLKDIDAAPVGVDFRSTLRSEIELCDVMLVLIGPDWLRVLDEYGRRRLDHPDDFVRSEIETALQLAMPVVPVLVGGASMPPMDALPTSLRGLAYRNAVLLRPDPNYHLDSDRLIHALEELVGSLPKATGERLEDVPQVEVPTSGPLNVFVSHATRDRKWVEREVVRFLEQHNIRPWYSSESIKTASQWEREILRGMESCDWFLLVVSPRAAQSEWIKDELNWAIFNRPTRIIPLIMEASNLWAFHIRLPRLQHIDFTEDADRARNALLTFLRTAA